MTQKVTLIEGDGIGPEISKSLIDIFAAAEVPVEWDRVEAGLSAFEKTGEAVGSDVFKSLCANKIAIKGPTTTPVGKGHRSINVKMRKKLDLFVNIRPCKSLECMDLPFNNVDLIVVRENIEDTYAGVEYKQSEDSCIGIRLATKSGARRAHKFAFELAVREGRKKVTCVHKANIMKLTDGLWLEAFREVAKDYPQIEADDIIVDNCCMQLVRWPEAFDVLVLPNLFGDIVSDLCAGLVGGLGVASGANIGKDCAIFEAVHGSAPDIAGKGLANPTALLRSAVSMLKYMKLDEYASKIDVALHKALECEQSRTGDLSGKGNTESFTKKVIECLA